MGFWNFQDFISHSHSYSPDENFRFSALHAWLPRIFARCEPLLLQNSIEIFTCGVRLGNHFDLGLVLAYHARKICAEPRVPQSSTRTLLIPAIVRAAGTDAKVQPR